MRPSTPRSTRRRRATARCSRSCSSGSPRRTRRRRRASRRSTSRISSCTRATCSATTRRSASARACASARSWSTSSRTRTASSATSSTCCGAPETEIFFVGDEYQSIYGFRHADVRRLPRAPRAVQRSCCRSRSTTARGPRCSPRSTSSSARISATSSSRSRRRRSSPIRCSAIRSSCSITDKASYSDTDVHWRRAEARAVARRVRELVDTGTAVAGEIVLLFAAGTDAEVYEEELRKTGLADVPRDRAGATSASSRSSTCSRTCACCTTATTTRRS